MGQTRAQIKESVRVNLEDLGVTFYSEDDLNDALQDAYDDIACLSQCIVKKVSSLHWIANLVYYNPSVDLELTDYLGCVAIFNQSTNRWLRDDLGLRDFDRIRRDWENWIGTPQFWSPSDPKRFAIAPHYSSSEGHFDMIYWATAPVISSDSGTYLIATDVHNLLEFYTTADMLEQAQEFTKATEFWNKYFDSLVEYSDRVKKNNSADLLLRV